MKIAPLYRLVLVQPFDPYIYAEKSPRNEAKEEKGKKGRSYKA
jgi:hypothetical protein